MYLLKGLLFLLSIAFSTLVYSQGPSGPPGGGGAPPGGGTGGTTPGQGTLAVGNIALQNAELQVAYDHKNDAFKILWNKHSNKTAEIRIMDSVGRLIADFSKVSTNNELIIDTNYIKTEFVLVLIKINTETLITKKLRKTHYYE